MDHRSRFHGTKGNLASSPAILGLLPTNVDLLLEFFWHVGQVDMELVCFPKRRGVGMLLMGFDLSVILDIA